MKNYAQIFRGMVDMNEHVIDFYLYLLNLNEKSDVIAAKKYLRKAWDERKRTF